MIADDMGKHQNCALAMRHARFLEKATTANLRLEHIVEMPLFVRSELSEGVQLADLCSYSIEENRASIATDDSKKCQCIEHQEVFGHR